MAMSVADFWRDPALTYRAVREQTSRLCGPLEVEDYGLQSMPDASPVKWHLAHTAWFFETFVLARVVPDYTPFHPQFGYLFNSYYETVGRMHPRSERGVLSRPTVADVWRYREHVDAKMVRWLESGAATKDELAVAELGLHHEQQHQELILTDLKHAFSRNALQPVYAPRPELPAAGGRRHRWLEHEGGIVAVGHPGEGFHFDNEGPRHDVLLQPFQVADRQVTCGEWLEFMHDDGYARAELWLSAGWHIVNTQGWRAPLYWRKNEGEWSVFTLHGTQALDPNEPVCHVSLFEADAFARWAGARLPTEFEWEASLGTQLDRGNIGGSATYHPRPAGETTQAFGETWAWTSSAYAPYPGYRPPPGALGEYNGKFMCSQLVLRGASCATPHGHTRPTYRNFFHPGDRWQFSGVQLARDS